MPRGPRVDTVIKQRVAQMLADGERSPAAIHRQLLREFPPVLFEKNKLQPVHVPTERTIARLVKQLHDPSGPWSLAECEPNEGARVLPVAAEVAVTTLGRAWPTRALAAWIDRIVATAPDIPPWECWRMAIGFRAAEGAGDEQAMKAMTIRLACRPWTPEGRKRWRRLQEKMPEVTTWDVGFEGLQSASYSVSKEVDDHDIA